MTFITMFCNERVVANSFNELVEQLRSARNEQLDMQLIEAGVFETADLSELDRELQQENADLADLIIGEQYGLSITAKA